MSAPIPRVLYSWNVAREYAPYQGTEETDSLVAAVRNTTTKVRVWLLFFRIAVRKLDLLLEV